MIRISFLKAYPARMLAMLKYHATYIYIYINNMIYRLVYGILTY